MAAEAAYRLVRQRSALGALLPGCRVADLVAILGPLVLRGGDIDKWRLAVVLGRVARSGPRAYRSSRSYPRSSAPRSQSRSLPRQPLPAPGPDRLRVVAVTVGVAVVDDAVVGVAARRVPRCRRQRPRPTRSAQRAEGRLPLRVPVRSAVRRIIPAQRGPPVLDPVLGAPAIAAHRGAALADPQPRPLSSSRTEGPTVADDIPS